jgi:hypothetical protein
MMELSDRARAELETLRDSGIEPTWTEVIQIHSLVELIKSPSNERLNARGNPVRIPGAILWPFTEQAGDWWNQNVDWFDGLKDKTRALGYLMAHGRRACLRARLASQPVARRAVSVWARRLPCRHDELLLAVGEVLESMQGVEDEIPESAKSDSIKTADDSDTLTNAEAVAFLVANTGLEAEYWERKVCIPYFSEQIQTIVRQGRCDDTPAKDDPRIIAERNLGYVLMKIEERGPDDGK